MERLTPIDIENKKFKKSLIGLNKGNVEQFLNEILDTYEETYRENISLRDKINNLQDVVAYYKGLEDTLKKTLLVAEQTGEEIVATAKKKAEQIENEAHVSAKTIVGQAESEARRINIQKEQLIASYDATRAKMYQYLKTQMDLTMQEDDEMKILSNLSSSDTKND